MIWLRVATLVSVVGCAPMPSLLKVDHFVDDLSGFKILLARNTAQSHFRVEVQRQAPHLNGTLVWRVRLVGPQIKLVRLFQDEVEPGAMPGTDVWAGDFSIECQGEYTLHFISEFDNFFSVFDRVNVRHVLADTPIHIQSAGIADRCPLQHSPTARRTPLPLCTPQLMAQDGLAGASWVVAGDEDAQFRASDTVSVDDSLKCLREHVRSPDCEGYNFAFSRALLRFEYRFLHCRMPADKEIEAAFVQRSGRRFVCIVGDSQSRHLFNDMIRLLEPENEECPQTGSKKETCDAFRVKIRYYYTMFAPTDQLATLNDECDVMLVNFGQWPLSYLSGRADQSNNPRPYSLSEYRAAVAEFMDDVKVKVRDYKSRFVWVGINAFPHRDETLLGNDWRTLNNIRTFNWEAHKVAQAVGVKIIDTSEIAQVLFDLTYDMAHYLAPVDHELARVQLHLINSFFP